MADYHKCKLLIFILMEWYVHEMFSAMLVRVIRMSDKAMESGTWTPNHSTHAAHMKYIWSQMENLEDTK